MSSIFSLKWKDVVGALVSAVIVGILGYLLSVGDVFKLDYHSIVNIAVMTGATSLLKALLTNSQGNFVGVLPVKDAS